MKTNFTSKFYFLILAILFFYEPLNQFVSPLSFLDEILGIVAAFSLCRYFIRKKEIPYSIVIIFLLIIGIIVCGLLSSYLSDIEVTWPNRLINLFSLLKNQLVFLWLMLVPTIQNKKNTIKLLEPIIKVFILISFTFAIINAFHDIGMSYDIRFSLRSFKFIYSNPATLNDRILCSIAILVGSKGISKNIFYILLGSVVVILTLRANGLAAIVVLWSLFLLLKFGEKITFKKIVFVALIAIATGWQSIKNYLIENVTPRGMMLRNGVALANQHFPLGAGLGTYGSDIAFKFYSPIYYQLGYDKIWVLAPITGTVATDNFWPMMFGQYGWIASILFLIILLVQIYILNRYITNNELKVTAITLFSYMIMKSMGEAVYTAVYGMLLYSFIAVLYQREDDIE